MKEIFLSEIRGSLSSNKLLVAFFLMLIAFLISLGMMNQEFEKRLHNYRMSLSLPAKELFWNKIFFWEFEGDDFTSSDDATMPLAKIKDPDPLIFFARGFDTEMRQGIDFMSSFPIFDINKQPEQEKNLLHLIFPAPDLLFMAKVLVSLLAMLFAFDIICGEREKGTLKLMMVAGASRGSIFTGKYLGGLVSIWIAFTGAFIIYLLALSFLTPVNLNGGAAPRIALIYLVALLHIAVFFSFGAVISAFSRSSPSSLVMTLFIWIIVVFVMPGLASLVAQQFAPVESEDTLAQMKFRKARDMEREYSEANPGSDTSRTGAYGVRHDEIRPQIVAELQKIEDEHQRRKDLQIALTSNLARISPIGSLSHLFTSLSRTGIGDVHRFREDLINLRTSLETQFSEVIRNPEFMVLWGRAGWDIPKEIKEIAEPFFDMNRTMKFSKPTLEETLGATWYDLGQLAFFAIVAAALAFTRFIFYDAR
ncbi:MAG TPA: ABC transporter permease [Acidobacteriota bacterium]|nr:ABC transporter permease [Acidobacteriota bacterium]